MLVLLSSLCWGHILGNIEIIICVRALDTVLHWYIAILQNINLLNDNFSFCTSLTRLYVVHRYIVVKEEMNNQPNVLYIGRLLYLVHISLMNFHHNMLYSCTCICVRTYTRIHTHTITHERIHTFTHKHTYMYIHVHANIHAHGGTPHTCENAHTHTHR